MPSWLSSREARREGPTPFSSEWIRSPAPPRPSHRLGTLPAWVPSERLLSGLLVLLLAVTTALLAADGGERKQPGAMEAGAGTEGSGVRINLLAGGPAVLTTGASDAALPSATAVAPPVGVGAAGPAPTQTPTYVPVPAFDSPAEVPIAPPLTGELLPTYRILTYYGHPHDPNMGILGEYSMEELLARLQTEAANYEAADPSRPVIPAFELIATVAQPVPGSDGTYILDTDEPTLTEYIDFAEANDMLVFLDLQIGRGTVAAEIEKVRALLERPHVHLALDPEFAIAEGEIPGEYIGELGAESITYAQETLAALAEENGLPPKVLIVHQFREDMIIGKEQLAPVPGVQLVIDADGYGAPELKTDVYNILVRDQPVEFGGVKLFYKQDKPLMTAAEILALNPSPDVVIYQ